MKYHTYLITSKGNFHNCLNSNRWCWKNVLENPLDALRFIKDKLNQKDSK